MKYNNHIAEIRKEKGWTQKQLAQKIGMTNQAISLYEKGKREPKIETWLKLTRVLQTPLGYLQGTSKIKTFDDLKEHQEDLSKKWAIEEFNNTFIKNYDIKDNFTDDQKILYSAPINHLKEIIMTTAKPLKATNFNNTKDIEELLEQIKLTNNINKILNLIEDDIISSLKAEQHQNKNQVFLNKLKEINSLLEKWLKEYKKKPV